MAVPPRSTFGSPIKTFLAIPAGDTLDAVNAVVTDSNVYLATFAAGKDPNTDTVANLTLKLIVEGQNGFATNGRKVGEGGGSGTGVQVYFSNGALRVKSTDAAVQT